MANLSDKVTPSGVATIASPTFTGVPSAPTATAGTDTKQIASTAFVRDAIPNVLNATGSAPVFACRAWVNFNGVGVVAIRASGNVSSITDIGPGSYRINFATDMPDADYAVNLSGNNTPSYGYSFSVPANGAVPAVGSIDVVTSTGASGVDLNYVYISVFR